MQLVTCAHNPMKAQHVVPGLGKELPRIHVCGPGCLGGWTNWSQNAAADHRTQPGRPHERNSSDIHALSRELGNVSDNMFPHCCPIGNLM